MDERKVSLRYAIAWIYARHLKFSEFVDQKPEDPIEDLWLGFNASFGLGLSPLLPSTAKAWQQLNKARAERMIELRGLRWVKGALSPSRTGNLITNTVEPIGEICRDLTEVGGTFGVRWCDVRLSQASLMNCFPERGKAATKRKDGKLTKKEALIHKALMHLPENTVLLGQTERDDQIISWISENINRPGGKKVSVHPSTIRRYLARTESDQK